MNREESDEGNDRKPHRPEVEGVEEKGNMDQSKGPKTGGLMATLRGMCNHKVVVRFHTPSSSRAPVPSEYVYTKHSCPV